MDKKQSLQTPEANFESENIRSTNNVSQSTPYFRRERERWTIAKNFYAEATTKEDQSNGVTEASVWLA